MYIPWYIHTAANVYHHRNKIARASTAYYAYKSTKAIMPYLRGTKSSASSAIRPYSSSRPTTRLATELKALHRKLNKQRPETKHWFHTFAYTHTAGLGTRGDYNITTGFHSNPAFRDNVLGDKWRNLWLDLRIISNRSNMIGACRVVVYKPKRPGNTWPGFFNDHIDPNDYTVLYDKILRPQPGTTIDLGGTVMEESQKKLAHRVRVNLRNTITSFDSSVRKGEIRYAILCDNDATSLAWISSTNMMLAYQNM